MEDLAILEGLVKGIIEDQVEVENQIVGEEIEKDSEIVEVKTDMVDEVDGNVKLKGL